MATLSSETKYKLNNFFGGLAKQIALGDLLEDAMSTSASEIDLTAVAQDVVSTKSTQEYFKSRILQAAAAGGVPTGTTGDVNVFSTDKNSFEWKVLGTQTLVSLVYTEGTGVDFALDQTADDGVEITQGITSSSKSAFTAGTDRCYFQTRLKLADVSGTDDCAAGFRKAEAYQSAIDSYDEMAAINVISGDVTIETILNNASTSSTDTTENVADTNYVDLRVEVDHTAGLAAAIALANSLKSKYNAHCADATEHTTAADTTNLVTTTDATDLASLKTLVAALLTKYVLHDDDAELGSSWVYHVAQEGSNHSLASAVAPTTLPQCHARLNDLKAKLNAHDADTTCHAADTLHQESTADSGNVCFKVGVNGAAVDAPPTTAAFSFDDGEVIVPFVYFLQHTDCCDTAYLQQWLCGLLS